MGSRSPNGHAALDKIRNYQATRFMVRVQFQPHRNRRLAMTVWEVSRPPIVIANAVKQSMSRSLHGRDVVGFREVAAWIATGLRPSP